MNIKNSFQNKQRGATLVTSMMMLTIMTIIGVSAAKVSTTDILIAGNDQQKMDLFQTMQTDLSKLATPLKLLPPLIGEEDEDGVIAVFDAHGKYTTGANSDSEEIITDMGKEYPCGGDGRAVSMGPSAPLCRLYDFNINAKKTNSSAKEEGHRGAGKEVPNPRKDSYLAN